MWRCWHAGKGAHVQQQSQARRTTWSLLRLAYPLLSPTPLSPPLTQVEVVEESDGWMLVRDGGGHEGLVPTSYLHLDRLYPAPSQQQVGVARRCAPTQPLTPPRSAREHSLRPPHRNPLTPPPPL